MLDLKQYGYVEADTPRSDLIPGRVILHEKKSGASA